MDSPEFQEGASGIAWLPLVCAIGIMLLLSIYPTILVRAGGHVDKIASYLLFWAMAAGYVRGVGFIPKSRILATIFSSASCYLALVASVSHLCLA